jgi:hypothetical protein
MKKLLIILLLLVPYIFLGQEKCGTDAILEQQLQDPKFARSFAKLEKRVQDLQKSKSVFNPITIPVIVHIIHEGEPYGTGYHFTTDYVYEAIDNLNENFAGEFSDDPTANTQISFCVATNSVDGDPIDGIRYYNWNDFGYDYDINEFRDDNLNNVNLANDISYDRPNYCNIYVLNWGGGTLGFAYVPPSNYGIYIQSPFFGVTNEGSYGLNKTLVHEAGHYCGLYHTFHFTNSCDSETNCNAQGDRVCDTPPTTVNYGCSTTGGACGNSLVENFMDYSNDNCVNSFTQGQTLRMLAELEETRPGIVANTLACGAVDGIDISVNGLLVPAEGCYEDIDGVSVQLNNFGNPVTELDIVYTVNGVIQTIPWVGNLDFGETETIPLPTANTGFGNVVIEVEALIDNDLNYENNSLIYEFDNFEGVAVNLEIEFDALPAGFDWVLYEAENGEPIGEPIAESEYEVGIEFNETYSCETLTYEFCLEEGEYIIILTDLFGNGMFYPCSFEDGYEPGYVGVEINGDTLVYTSGNWGDEEELPFIVEFPCLPLGDCPWDLNGDGIVNAPDLLIILQNFTLEYECSPMDFNQNGSIDSEDVLDVISYFGSYCIGDMIENNFNKSSIEYYIHQAGGKITHSELYDLQGRKVNEDKIYLQEGIYVIRQYWDNGFVTTKKLYLNSIK